VFETLLDKCWLGRFDLSEKPRAKAPKNARAEPRSVSRKDAGFLMHHARELHIIEEDFAN
jgi:hypothetical protein